MGRHAKPTVMKILEGNPGRRPLPEGEVMPDIAEKVPEPPKHLSDVAKEEWHTMGEKLRRLGLLTEIDMTAFAMYCQAYGRWVDAEEKVSATGVLIKTSAGNVIQSPMLSVAHRNMEICHKFLVEFGMTPSSRGKASTSIPPTPKKSKFSGLISDRYN